ncbi:hypothetical protein [Tahibacter amnicola]|uniref:Uncharacterized protein n=1 Tax=Tahibacter amnicola TaxID=2976241 RepID=A0ABY6BBU4_9GAMM|nr:hypothetical protein [Tahibacter amnicola]UXI67518.1 hypothetical protein N4264_22715 [Tahibacter amnicola]
MAASTQKMLLALRGSQAHWLAAIVNALDEALRDPDFGPEQRAIVRHLLDAGMVPASVARAAEARFQRFEQSFADALPEPSESDWPAVTPPTPPSRPKLTLVGNEAA